MNEKYYIMIPASGACELFIWKYKSVGEFLLERDVNMFKRAMVYDDLIVFYDDQRTIEGLYNHIASQLVGDKVIYGDVYILFGERGTCDTNNFVPFDAKGAVNYIDTITKRYFHVVNTFRF